LVTTFYPLLEWSSIANFMEELLTAEVE